MRQNRRDGHEPKGQIAERKRNCERNRRRQRCASGCSEKVGVCHRISQQPLKDDACACQPCSHDRRAQHAGNELPNDRFFGGAPRSPISRPNVCLSRIATICPGSIPTVPMRVARINVMNNTTTNPPKTIAGCRDITRRLSRKLRCAWRVQGLRFRDGVLTTKNQIHELSSSYGLGISYHNSEA